MYQCAAVVASQAVQHCGTCDEPPEQHWGWAVDHDDAEGASGMTKPRTVDEAAHTFADADADDGVDAAVAVASADAAQGGALAWVGLASAELGDNCSEPEAVASARSL